MAEILFPSTTSPSRNVAENGGRLINAYAEKAPEGAPNKFFIRRAPGLDVATSVGAGLYRGCLVDGTTLYVANGALLYSVTKSGSTYTVTAMTGALGGSGKVFMSHNMLSPTHNILLSTSAGMYQLVGTTLSSFSDPDLPSILHITYQDGYFFCPSAFGRIYASGLNSTGFASTDYVTAESSPDGLVRVVPYERNIWAMGDSSSEVWSNTGNATGFPYSRVTVKSIGLWGIYAVAGFEDGFPGPMMFVGNTNQIYQMIGYTPTLVRFPYLEYLISQISDRTTLTATSYMANGHAFWSLKSPTWCFVFDLTEGTWHERSTYEQASWRGSDAVWVFNEWLVFDALTTTVYRVNASGQRENLLPLVMDIRSQQQHNFPARTNVKRADFNFVRGVGIDVGIDPIESDPVVSISWSKDGGVTFGNPLTRELGTQGDQTQLARINRPCKTSNRGIQWRIQASDPVEIALIGGSMFGEPVI